jgi:molybdenum cofactor cytidylyltransferase
MSRSPSFCGVILAAGSSTRMGRDKALLPWPANSRNSTFLSSAIEALTRTTELVIVVAGENETSLEPVAYSRGAYLVRNPEPQKGQTSSLRVGLKAVLDRGRDAAVIMLVDRPAVSEATIEKLKQALQAVLAEGVWAVAPAVNGEHGHPLVVSREMMEAILRAPEAMTSREVLAANEQHLRYVEVDDAMALLNVNTPEEYQKASQSNPGEAAH